MFYSRRIGGRPSARPTVNEGEEVAFQPNAVELINATKVSGRTEGGLGIGLFNAVTNEAFAQIRNVETGRQGQKW